MKTHLAPLTVAVILALGVPAALLGPAPELAARTRPVTKRYDVDVRCTSTGQTCTPPYATEITTSRRLKLAFTASRDHCSPIWITYRVDGQPSNFVLLGAADPGKTVAKDLGPVAAGSHLLELQAQGVPDTGCNTGSLIAWSGTLEVTTSKPVRR